MKPYTLVVGRARSCVCEAAVSFISCANLEGRERDCNTDPIKTVTQGASILLERAVSHGV